MSKFDRGVFIFIGLGIWALAMSQFLKPSILNAVGMGCGTLANPCYVKIASPEAEAEARELVFEKLEKEKEIFEKQLKEWEMESKESKQKQKLETDNNLYD